LLITEGLQVPVTPLGDVVPSAGTVPPEQNGPIGLKLGTTFALTTTSICALTLSHPLAFVCVTQYEVVPTEAVDGVGAAELPVPPTAVVYHNIFDPVAAKGTAVAPWQ